MPKRKNKPKRSLENVHEEYDENGRWNQERNRVKGALRQSFRMSPQMWETLQRARHELPPALKKDGTPGKRPQVRYKCAICGGMFMQKYVQVDHVDPVVPLYKVEADMSYDEMAYRIFCKQDNLQVVCSTPLKKNDGKPSCHKIKSDEENFIRKKMNEYRQELIRKAEEKPDVTGLRSAFAGSFVTALDDTWFGADKSVPELIEQFRLEFQDYLKDKEEKRLAKERRKAEREAKRLAKIEPPSHITKGNVLDDLGITDEKRQRNRRKSKKA